MGMSEPLGCQRELFDIPPSVAYLNCAYMGPMSRPVVAAAREGLERKLHPWTIGKEDFFDPVEELRGLCGRLVGGDADGVALTPSVSYGIGVAAQNLRFDRGSRIVVLAEEFPSNVYAWRELADREHGEVTTVSRPSDGDWTSALLEHIDDRTAVVATANCHWTDGGLIDLVRVGERARAVGAALVVDGIQSIGALPFDVTDVQPDFVVTALYKWLLGPYSSGFLWCAPQHRSGRPVEYNWKARVASDDFQHLVSYQMDYRTGSRRYDVGEASNFALVPAATAALRQTLDWGVDRVAAYTRGLTDRIAENAASIGLGVAPPHQRSGHLIGVRLHGADPEALAEAMARANVFVSVRGDAMRVAPHVYNDAGDVDRLFEVLRATI